ncbi:GNAT family N-acetyltransferase [Spirochaeta dissipatitropha]
MTTSHSIKSTRQFLDLREFVSSSVYRAANPWNYYDLDRLNFCFTVSSAMNGTSMQDFLDRSRIWRDEQGKIVSAVVSEGENRGEAFFLCTEKELDIATAAEMIEFAEEYCSCETENKQRFCAVRVPDHQEPTRRFLRARGYSSGDWCETYSRLDISTSIAGEQTLPDSYTLIEGRDCSPELKGRCHAQAFGYSGEGLYESRIVTGFSAMQETPDYLPFLDLMIIDGEGEPAAMMGFWYDALNRRGNLEPAGTVPAHRGRGLGRFLIQEGSRRLQRLGANHILVGTDLEFYLRSGFSVIQKTPVLEKRFM